ncbi:hypothetical protein MASR2M18_11420 [Ignavibacteria bacterium]|nr:hypothetical protein [Bacteroidota bacterium]MCZ2132565.1 hypothetical protein [Bacteroidota bacterium]
MNSTIQYIEQTNTSLPHLFHIPVMGISYTIDAPLKVARFGISSVVSIVEDGVAEGMRKFYCNQEGEPYVPITQKDPDYRARRISEYLNLLERILQKQMETIKSEPFEKGKDIVKYFEMLPDSSREKILFERMQSMEDGTEKYALQEILRSKIVAGSIDANIMTKCDKTNYSADDEPLPAEYNDAMAALRGYAQSRLHSSIVFSAGMNPRLFSYCESFADFFPQENGMLNKKIILKVSDYRSAYIQGKFLAKKGLWVSEFRIESGLNCGGHAFATDGYLLGPALEEFKMKRESLADELFEICNNALRQKGKNIFEKCPESKVTVQGGIGTANENYFLLEYYRLDGTGWGSPFLLAPEVTNLDRDTLRDLATAQPEDYYLSYLSSPLGVPFNNFKKSSGEKDRLQRIEKNRPGSPCYNKHLTFNTEFTEKPICTASREYQNLKIKQLESMSLPPEKLKEEIDIVTSKECLCHGLEAAAYLKKELPPPHKLKAVSICPGPNLAFFSGEFSLADIVDHIYGRKNILNSLPRPNMFLNELKLYIDYLKNDIVKNIDSATERKLKSMEAFKSNLLEGVEYYKSLTQQMVRESEQYRKKFRETLHSLEQSIQSISLPELVELS